MRVLFFTSSINISIGTLSRCRRRDWTFVHLNLKLINQIGINNVGHLFMFHFLRVATQVHENFL